MQLLTSSTSMWKRLMGEASFRGQSVAVDLEEFRLRRFVENLPEDELDERRESVDLADLPNIIDGNPRAVLFRRAGPDAQEVVASVCASRSRLSRAFGVTPSGLFGEVQRRLRNQAQILEVPRDVAPCQQVVLQGEEADLTRLPIHLQHGLDGAPYISSAIDYVLDPKSGLTNVGIRRLMLRGPREAGADLVAPSDLKAIYEASARAGERLPVSFVVGAHPVDYVAAMMRLPVDELGVVAALRDKPLGVVKCVTNDIRVPADAEMVLEGYLDERGHVEPEGPYGEFLGYYGALKRNPVFHLTAITCRKDALFQTMSISGPALGRTDTAQLAALRAELTVWNLLRFTQQPRAVACSIFVLPFANVCRVKHATQLQQPLAHLRMPNMPSSWILISTSPMMNRWIGRSQHAFRQIVICSSWKGFAPCRSTPLSTARTRVPKRALTAHGPLARKTVLISACPKLRVSRASALPRSKRR
jgi:UbiD family decarboxylase